LTSSKITASGVGAGVGEFKGLVEGMGEFT